MTAQMATRLTLHSFKHKKRKVSIIKVCSEEKLVSLLKISVLHEWETCLFIDEVESM